MGERTYELIAYRMPENYGKSREIDRNSVLAMNDRYYPRVFDNLDLKRKRILITPCGYDPILCGIRGLTEHDVLSAWRMIKPREPVEFTQLFATNQATDAHLVNKRITEVKPYDCVILSGKVASNPKTVPGGHVIFRISDKTGSIYCAAYKKTGLLRDIASQLVVGDDITAYGGICKHKETVNLEKLEIRRLEKILKFMHPLCCGKRMSSAGKNKGYKCKKCGKKISQRFVELSQVNRSIKPGIYDVQPGSRRHLSKPLFLYGFLGGKSGK